MPLVGVAQGRAKETWAGQQGRGARPASPTALLLGWGECLDGGRKPGCPAPTPPMVLRSFSGFQCRAHGHSACPRAWLLADTKPRANGHLGSGIL